jgi:hypothetical protein
MTLLLPVLPLRPALLALLLAGAAGAPTQAQTRSLDAELALGSDLTERGAFVGGRGPLVQAAASVYDASGWTLGGAWGLPASGLRNSRVVLRGAWDRRLVGDWQGQASLQYYGYPSSTDGRGFDRFEAGLALSWRDRWALGVTGFHYLHPDPQTAVLDWAIDVGSRWPLAKVWSAQAALGLAQVRQRSAHGYASLGLAWHEGDWRAEVNWLATTPQARRSMPGSTRGHLSAVLTHLF